MLVFVTGWLAGCSRDPVGAAEPTSFDMTVEQADASSTPDVSSAADAQVEDGNVSPDLDARVSIADAQFTDSGADEVPLCRSLDQCRFNCGGDADCVEGCLRPYSPEILALHRALSDCAAVNYCRSDTRLDLNCMATHCADETAACWGPVTEPAGNEGCTGLVQCLENASGGLSASEECVESASADAWAGLGALSGCARENSCAAIDLECLEMHCTDQLESCGLPTSRLILDLDLRCQPQPAAQVRIAGAFWLDFDPEAGPVALDEDGDGIWRVIFTPPPDADMLYLWVVDGTYENLVDAGACAPDAGITREGRPYANRVWTVGDANRVDTYGTCGICDAQACRVDADCGPAAYCCNGLCRPEDLMSCGGCEVSCDAGRADTCVDGECQCAGGPACPENLRCSPNGEGCVECVVDADCGPGAPHCIDGDCAACASNDDCDGDTPVCSPTTRICAPCFSNEQCGDGSVCEESGRCRRCDCPDLRLTVCGGDHQNYRNGCLADCAGVFVVATGACQPCQLDMDCGQGDEAWVCVAPSVGLADGPRVCLPCAGAQGCFSGGDCYNNLCVPECTMDAECPASLFCSNGRCIQCNDDMQCADQPTGLACYSARVGNRCGCRDDSECRAGLRCDLAEFNADPAVRAFIGTCR